MSSDKMSVQKLAAREIVRERLERYSQFQYYIDSVRGLRLYLGALFVGLAVNSQIMALFPEQYQQRALLALILAPTLTLGLWLVERVMLLLGPATAEEGETVKLLAEDQIDAELARTNPHPSQTAQSADSLALKQVQCDMDVLDAEREQPSCDSSPSPAPIARISRVIPHTSVYVAPIERPSRVRNTVLNFQASIQQQKRQ
jgi:hypothetical protein